MEQFIRSSSLVPATATSTSTAATTTATSAVTTTAATVTTVTSPNVSAVVIPAAAEASAPVITAVTSSAAMVVAVVSPSSEITGKGSFAAAVPSTSVAAEPFANSLHPHRDDDEREDEGWEHDQRDAYAERLRARGDERDGEAREHEDDCEREPRARLPTADSAERWTAWVLPRRSGNRDGDGHGDVNHTPFVVLSVVVHRFVLESLKTCLRA